MPDSKPNILVIWGDDIGITNLSCYSDGLMGYRTPNIDRIADEGMRFTDSYGEQSWTVVLHHGPERFRTGLSKVGVPAAPTGLQAEDPTIAELLKPLGYATGQFGKNHLGDRSRRPGDRRQAQDWSQHRRYDLQGAHRRLHLLPYLTGVDEKGPRQGFVYFSDDGDVLGIRVDNWKIVFHGTMQLWAEPFIPLRLPKLFNLRTDPFERADVTSNTYWDWLVDNGILVLTASAVVAQFLESFKEFPPRQKAASFTIDQAMAKLEAALTEGR